MKRLEVVLPAFLNGFLKLSTQLQKGNIVAVPVIKYYRVVDFNHQDSGYGFVTSWCNASPVEPKRFTDIPGKKISILTNHTFEEGYCAVTHNTDHPSIAMQTRVDQMNQKIRDGKLVLKRDKNGSLVLDEPNE